MTRLPPGAPITRAATLPRSPDAIQRAAHGVAQQVVRYAIGRPVSILIADGPQGEIARAAARMLAGQGVEIAATDAPVILDGRGGTGTPPSPDAFVIAIDLPTGRADVTLAIGTLRPDHIAARCGTVIVVDPVAATDPAWRTIARPHIAPPADDAHKYSRGLVVVLVGSMPGAARLSAHAALAGGAGYVVLAGDDAGQGGPDALVRRSIAQDAALADMLRDDRLAAVLVGPGLGRDAAATRLLDAALACHAPLVIDGDAITLLGPSGVARIAARDAPALLTPHAGEFTRMFPDPSGDKLDRTLAAARHARATIVHKGSDTVIATPDGRAIVSTLGPSWLSTAGTGDVLAGLLAARLAPGGADAPEQAVWLHARAARLAGPAFVADDLIGHLGQAIGECR